MRLSWHWCTVARKDYSLCAFSENRKNYTTFTLKYLVILQLKANTSKNWYLRKRNICSLSLYSFFFLECFFPLFWSRKLITHAPIIKLKVQALSLIHLVFLSTISRASQYFKTCIEARLQRHDDHQKPMRQPEDICTKDWQWLTLAEVTGRRKEENKLLGYSWEYQSMVKERWPMQALWDSEAIVETEETLGRGEAFWNKLETKSLSCSAMSRPSRVSYGLCETVHWNWSRLGILGEGTLPDLPKPGINPGLWALGQAYFLSAESPGKPSQSWN